MIKLAAKDAKDNSLGPGGNGVADGTDDPDVGDYGSCYGILGPNYDGSRVGVGLGLH
jgi:hypothetical protein